MSNFWSGKRVLVTGGAGFVGSHLVESLVEAGARVRMADNFSNGSKRNLESVWGEIEIHDGDLRELSQCLRAVEGQEIVLNLAARVGGIGFNQKHPGTMFRDNVLVNTNVLEAARSGGVERFLVISSACVYPRLCTIPTPESEGFVGVPEPTNDGYGWAKRMAEIQAEAYHREYGMKVGIVRPYNTYGPRDHFEPDKSHVIPALIKRIFDDENPLVVWGSGEQTRAFLYVADFVRGVMEAIEKYPLPDPLNLGTDEEVKIRDLVQMIVELSGKRPRIYFDTSKPEGQPRRNCDTSKAKAKIGFEARVKLRDGLALTIEWYREEFGFS